MKLTPIKTEKIIPDHPDLFKILESYLPKIKERSILAITSKIISICEGRYVNSAEADKDDLIEQESQFFLPRESNPYEVSLTITRNNLVATAGIDESNGNGYFILWPKDPQQSANKIREFLKEKYGLNEIGVVITDSKTTPFRWGVTAIALAYSGFAPLKDYIGTPDIFGNQMHFTKMSIIDNLASAAALVMGEGNEQTPIALIEDLPNIEFRDSNPTDQEIENLKINIDEDLYSLLLKSAPWKKGKAS